MFSIFNPLLYFVTPEIGDDIEKWVNLIRQVVEGGVQMVQVRDKKSSAKKIITAINRINPLLKQTNVSLLINDYVDIAFAVQADGVHLGQSDSKVSEARSILGDGAIIGLSVETLDQAVDAEREKVNYLAASPVFTSRTKLDCTSPWGILGLAQLCKLSSHPIIAIGGIDLTNCANILECKIAGIAVVSAIASAKNPQLATKKILNKMRIYADSRLG